MIFASRDRFSEFPIHIMQKQDVARTMAAMFFRWAYRRSLMSSRLYALTYVFGKVVERAAMGNSEMG